MRTMNPSDENSVVKSGGDNEVWWSLEGIFVPTPGA